tara:strand:+ start:1552 stop:2280 length:729 start_codon:yes stop_codon:yes gene_type:complete
MLKTYVINLAGSDQRWEATSSRLKELGLPFERFEAVDGRVNPHPLFARYDDKLREKYRRRVLSGGELGCFASHFTLWQKCIELNQSIVVMEDDIIINDTYPEALVIAENNVERFSYLRFAGITLKGRPFKKIEKIGGFDLIDHIRGPAGTQCYFITPKAAQVFIDNASVWYLAVDDFMDRYWGHKIPCYSLMPFPVLLADVETDMKRIKKGNRPINIKIMQEFYGLLERLRRVCYRINLFEK